MPIANLSSFGSTSFMAAKIRTNTVTVTSLSLAFLPSASKRKANLVFTASAADTFDIEIEFTDERFEELTMTGERKT